MIKERYVLHYCLFVVLLCRAFTSCGTPENTPIDKRLQSIPYSSDALMIKGKVREVCDVVFDSILNEADTIILYFDKKGRCIQKINRVYPASFQYKFSGDTTIQTVNLIDEYKDSCRETNIYVGKYNLLLYYKLVKKGYAEQKTFVYNVKGYKTEEYDTFAQGNFVTVMKHIYKYDAADKLVEDDWYEKGLLYDKTFYSYKNEHVTKEVSIGSSGDTAIESYFEYDGESNTTVIDIKAGRNSYTSKYKWDKEGRQIKMDKNSFYAGGRGIKESTIRITEEYGNFDNNNNWTQQTKHKILEEKLSISDIFFSSTMRKIKYYEH